MRVSAIMYQYCMCYVQCFGVPVEINALVVHRSLPRSKQSTKKYRKFSETIPWDLTLRPHPELMKDKRETWTRQIDFLFVTLALCVGLSNIWVSFNFNLTPTLAEFDINYAGG